MRGRRTWALHRERGTGDNSHRGVSNTAPRISLLKQGWGACFEAWWLHQWLQDGTGACCELEYFVNNQTPICPSVAALTHNVVSIKRSAMFNDQYLIFWRAIETSFFFAL